MYILSVTSHIKCVVACCLINVVYLTACAFIRSWWHCTFWVTSPMTLSQQKIENYAIIASLKSERMGKLINRIPVQDFQAGLWKCMLNRSASLAMSTSVLKALPGKLDIKRHLPRVFSIYWLYSPNEVLAVGTLVKQYLHFTSQLFLYLLAFTLILDFSIAKGSKRWTARTSCTVFLQTFSSSFSFLRQSKCPTNRNTHLIDQDY